MPNLTNARWVNLGDKLGIKCKLDDATWRTIEPSIEPYFFVRQNDAHKIREGKHCRIEKGEFMSPKEEKCVKVITKFPNEVREMKDTLDIPTFEADVPFCRRWMIDLDLKCSLDPRVLFFDMESDSRAGFPLPESPTQRIISLAGVDNKGKEFFFSDDDEIQMIKDFEYLLNKYDIVGGWNIAGWDILYLENRCAEIGYRMNFRKVHWLDCMVVYNQVTRGGRASLKLADVGEREKIGVKKLTDLYEHEGAEKMWAMFESNRDRLRVANVRDCEMVKRISDNVGIMTNIIETAHLSNLFYSDVVYYSRIVDSLLFKKALTKIPRIVFPTKPRRDDKKWKPYTGALVIKPEPGLYINGLNWDFKSLYPRIFRTFNVGIDTVWRGKGPFIKTEKLRFKVEPKSLFTEFLEELEEQRNKYIKLRDGEQYESKIWRRYQARQFQLKVISNATYGIIGARKLRFYDKDISESTTLTGQWLLKKMIEILDKYGLKTIAGDTDGVVAYFKEKPSLEKILKKIKSLEWLINKELKKSVIKRFGVPEDRYALKIKLDSIYTKIYFGKEKKKYVGEVLSGLTETTLDDYGIADVMKVRNRKVVGYELKKSDTPNVVRRIQEKIFDIIFSEESSENIEAKVIEYLRKMKRFLNSGGFDEDLTISKGTRRKIEAYKMKDIHVNVAKKLFEQGILRPGDAVLYVVVGQDDHGRLQGEPVLKGKKFPKVKKSGYEYYFYRRILPTAEKILGKKINVDIQKLDKWI